ncbi:hypothetical protein D0Y65_003487 [Glycine soja]|uniref:Uncharacterized protein n=1 Tax=Glycine soja TaxID=3848 RepID=A0A445LM44_GLYSO|nr:hypothetical protein D0Y65_003487 [Glycine soja]
MVLSRSLELQHDLRTQEVEVHVHFRNYIFANQRTRSSSNMLVRELTTVQCEIQEVNTQYRPAYLVVKEYIKTALLYVREHEGPPEHRPVMDRKPNKKYSSLMMGKQK